MFFNHTKSTFALLLCSHQWMPRKLMIVGFKTNIIVAFLYQPFVCHLKSVPTRHCTYRVMYFEIDTRWRMGDMKQHYSFIYNQSAVIKGTTLVLKSRTKKEKPLSDEF